MQITLPKELENMVKERVQSGLYGNASEVIRAALRMFFHISEENLYSTEETEDIRNTVKPRLDALQKGDSITHDFDTACAEINKDVFGG